MFEKCTTKKEAKLLFRKLAKRLHPDHGGDSELMKLLSDSYEFFCKVLTDVDEAPYRKSKREPEYEKYEKAYDFVYQGDEALDIVKDILAYSLAKPKFCMTFTNSVIDFLEEHQYVTEGQYNALLNIYISFRIWDKINER